MTQRDPILPVSSVITRPSGRSWTEESLPLAVRRQLLQEEVEKVKASHRTKSQTQPGPQHAGVAHPDVGPSRP